MSRKSLFSCLWLKYLLSGVVLGVLLVILFNWGMRISDSRPFCSSCHIMDQAAHTHRLSVHANLSCNDCHAPTILWKKIPFKAKEGIRDVFMNTFGEVQLPILPGVGTKVVVNENCKACHAMTNMDVASMEAKPYCVDCHRNIHHMRMKPISTRMVGSP